AEELQATRSRLERETLELEARLADAKSQLDAVSYAAQRAANYPVVVGRNYLCPKCWVQRNAAVKLALLRRGRRHDVYRCSNCGPINIHM
ncbi:MAG TPA: hypothetical protein VE218_01375, partial [Acidobacteriaceae bacterium]|nr:hypothetical protein [Acidobacteriaceae bacterium]